MVKMGKRILVIAVSSLMVLLIGCLIFTGNRLAGYPKDLLELERVVYEGGESTRIAFTGETAWYRKGNERATLLEFVDYNEGVITMRGNNAKYKFLVIDTDTIFDQSSKILLQRRKDGG